MFQPYQALTDLLVTAGEVRGRKKLQKIVYIAQSLGYAFPEPFDLHVWGPYSEVLAVKLQEMTEWGFAQEEVLPGPAGNHHYIYRPGPNAGYAAAGARTASQRLIELVIHLNSHDATLLEGVATVRYLRAKGKSGTAPAETLARLKPDKFPDVARIQPVLHLADALESYRHV